MASQSTRKKAIAADPLSLDALIGEGDDAVTLADLYDLLDAYDTVAMADFGFASPPDIERGEVEPAQHKKILKGAAEKLDLTESAAEDRWSVASGSLPLWDALEHAEQTGIQFPILRVIAAHELPAEEAEKAIEFASKKGRTLEEIHKDVSARKKAADKRAVASTTPASPADADSNGASADS